MSELDRYQKNLTILKEQAASYGADVPLKLLNDITYHEEKIRELRGSKKGRVAFRLLIGIIALSLALAVSLVLYQYVLLRNRVLISSEQWPIGNFPGKDFDIGRQPINNGYRFSTTSKIDFSPNKVDITNRPISDFYLAFDSVLVDESGKPDGTSDSALEIAFRKNDERYLVILTKNGCWLWGKDGLLTQNDGVSFGNSINFQKGVSYSFSISVTSSRIIVSANKNEVLTYDKLSMHEAGDVIIGTMVFSASQSVTFDISNITLQGK